ncbi:MAG: hypothetical protein HQK50_05220, partial [Oligoflexia bacterium]|nr:hypothetical protein [Oligoflexia bacterium]
MKSVIDFIKRHPNSCAVLFLFIGCAIYLSRYWCSFSFCGPVYALGNDFDLLYYRNKLYLLDVLANEYRLPLWSPSEAAGYPFYSNPFNAVFYPLNLLLVIFYKIFGGYSMLDHQSFAAFGIFLFALGLFVWLRSLSVSLTIALFASMAVGTSFKMTELMRFPNAIHAAAWLPWIMVGINLLLQKEKLQGRKGVALASFASISLATAGYPYYLYYSQFLIVPYVLLMLFPPTRSLLFIEKKEGGDTQFIDFKNGTLRLLIVLGIFLLSCGPYLWKISALMAMTQDRGGGDFNFAIIGSEWDWHDIVGSWIYPPAAMAEGWYYFGLCSCLLILTYFLRSIINALTLRKNFSDLFFIAIIALWFWFISDITMGAASKLFFKPMWKHWPAFSGLRVWPRMSIILLPLLALLLARALTRLQAVYKLSATLFSLAALGVAYAFVLATQRFLYDSGYHSRYFGYFNNPPFPREWYLTLGAVSVFILACYFFMVMLDKGRDRYRGLTLVTLLLLLPLNMIDVGRVGLLQWGSWVDAKSQISQRQSRPKGVNFTALSTPRIFTYDTLQIGSNFNVGRIANWYFSNYTGFLSIQTKIDNIGMHENNIKIEVPAETKRLLGMVDGSRLFFTQRADYQEVADFLNDHDKTATSFKVSIVPTRYNGDILEVTVKSDAGGYLSFIDNWEPRWSVFVNDRKSKL